MGAMVYVKTIHIPRACSFLDHHRIDSSHLHTLLSRAMSCSTKAILLLISFLPTVQRGSALKVAQTFSDSLTMIPQARSFEDCEIIYDPTLKKYLIHGDYCQYCARDWIKGIWHIDIWVGQKNYNGAGYQISCKDRLPSPPQKYVVQNPDPHLLVDSTSWSMMGVLGAGGQLRPIPCQLERSRRPIISSIYQLYSPRMFHLIGTV
ncbi:hypothetical protein ACMYSQ_008024 [Aspergillus niger]